ncbi:hypothetical protein ACTFIY_007975 [Dictyostelium cf. discoideum]
MNFNNLSFNNLNNENSLYYFPNTKYLDIASSVTESSQMLFQDNDNDTDDFLPTNNIEFLNQDDSNDSELEIDCESTHPYIKLLRNYQDQIFSPTTSSLVNLNNNININNNNNNNNSKPFKEILLEIESTISHYEKENESLLEINNNYFQLFLDNIQIASQNNRKIKKMESLLNEFKGYFKSIKLFK